MPILRNFKTFLLIASFISFSLKANALPSINKSLDNKTPTVLKANIVDGDKITNVITATGNVEITKGSSIIYANKVIYEKNGGIIRAIGNVRVKDIEVGNLIAKKARVKDDFTSGKFNDAKIIFNDGSYLTSPDITKKNAVITILKNPIFSICPNPEISADNSLAGKNSDFVTIKAKESLIDSSDDSLTSKGGILKFYKVPVLYMPYLKVPLPSKKKKSGFLHPSYARTSNLGFGLKLPYYFYIKPNLDLTVSPFIGLSNNQILVDNHLRHNASYGQYEVNFEFANNKIDTTNDSTVVNRTDKEYRWNLKSTGEFDFTNNTGLDFDINTVGDRDYLRDYNFDYNNHTLSKVNLDYIKGRSYYAVKLIRIQEIEDESLETQAPIITPFDAYIETKPLSWGQKFSLTSNFTNIAREEGLQYRRLTATPAIEVPLNLHGNLFKLKGEVQTDFYSLENNFKSMSANNDYDKSESNYKPQASLSWKLPLIKKTKSSTLVLEPMANMIISSYEKNFDTMPNEDSNPSELTVSNLFLDDRIYGFDRNESGKRLNYGVKASLFNDYGEFALNVGQGYKTGGNQDVNIRGFANNNKSNIVGQAMYRAVKYFSLLYTFQLDETNYRNEVNQVTASLDFDRVSFATSYLLIRENEQNANKRNQVNLSSKIKLTNRWNTRLGVTRDMVLGRNLTRSIEINREGCCTNFGFSVVETNQSNLSKPQKSFNLRFTFKNL